MAYKMGFSLNELTANLSELSSPEVKAGCSGISFESVKNNFVDVVKNRYFCFEGTADRKEFWQYILVAIIVAIIPLIGQLAALALLPATLGVTARRLHDTGKSGWLQLIGLIPVIGGIIVLILCLGKYKAAEKCGCGCCCGEQK